jgi:hypothetical protein
VEIVRKAALAILPQPVGIVEAFADFRDRIANGFLIFRKREVHGPRILSVAVIDLQVGKALPVSSIQRNCPSPEQLKAIPERWTAEPMLGIAKRPTFRKMAES